MNWLRILLDGVFMSAVFNLATGLILAYDPVIFTTAYPKELQKVAPKNPKAVKHKLLFTLFVIAPVVLFGVFSAYEAGIRGFWPLFATAYLEFFLVNLGDFFGLDWYLRKKLGTRWELPGTHGHPCYENSVWMKTLAIPEHWVLWPFVICPMFALISAGLGGLLVR